MTLTRLLRPGRTLTIAATLSAGAFLAAACGGGSDTPASTVASQAATNVATAANSSAGQTAVSGGKTVVSGATKSATGAFQDPCSLLTQDEVDTSVGQPLQAGKQVATLDDCQWTTADFTAGVDVTAGPWTSMKTAATGNSAVPTAISGVGDEALNLNGSNGSLLYVRKGDNGFLLTINGPHIDSLPDHGLAQEKVLAKAVLGRMK